VVIAATVSLLQLFRALWKSVAHVPEPPETSIAIQALKLEPDEQNAGIAEVSPACTLRAITRMRLLPLTTEPEPLPAISASST
jgi:hypothetical protein